MSFKTRASSNNQRAREAMLRYNLHVDDINFMLAYFDFRCAYCGCELTKDWQIDHIIPITEENIDVINFGSVAYNCVCVCENCNLSKGTHVFDTWVEKKFANSEEVKYRIAEYQQEAGINEILY